ncbi:MAG: hypothetical protein GVY16_08735 [Planctomycetes bacterium]|jgi:ABC-type transport system involved in cytochrome c biogenesis permease subunit|nr:cytochrome c biogenesis protein CcsA [Phycisphaerae bacterium]NBB95813.1 hypothetical protein [Planctomycetota bacterium]
MNAALVNPVLLLDRLHAALVLAALAFYGLAGLVLLLRRRRIGWACFALGGLAALTAVATRGLWTGHLPMQNLYEVFLLLAMLMFPLSALAKRLLGVGGEALDALLAAALLGPVAFVFSRRPQPLPPALQSWLFGPHVLAYMLAYVLTAKAAVQAGRVWLAGPADRPAVERGCARLIGLGFPLMTLGLVLGAVWGRRAWGDWWNWDPKELWSLATWLTVVAYLHLRTTLRRPRPRLQAAVAILAFLLVLITLLWANLGRIFQGLHSYA